MKYSGTCSGYSHDWRSSKDPFRPAPRTLIPQSQQGVSLSQYRPSQNFPAETEVENRYFQYFRIQASSRLSEGCDVALWDRIILQACHHEPSVRHTVIAIGALSKSFQISAPGIPVSAAEPSFATSRLVAKLHRQFALSKYSKALEEIKVIATSPAVDIRKALISSLLIFTFEGLLGNRHAAISTAHTGFELLRNWTIRNVSSQSQIIGLSSPRPSIIEDDVVRAFGKLDLQICMCVDLRPLKFHMASKDYGDDVIACMPEQFSDLIEARALWELVMRRTCHFASTAFVATDSKSLSVPFDGTAPGDTDVTSGDNIHSTSAFVSDHAINERAKYAADIRRWSASFDPLLHRLRQDLSCPERYVAACLLRIQALAMTVSLAGLSFLNQMSYDEYLPEFAEIMDLVVLYANVYNEGATDGSSPRSFLLEQGLLFPLLLVVTRCRDRSIRRRAIRVLQTWHSEGLGDNAQLAQIGLFMMEVEEEGVESEVIPERSRAIFTRINEDGYQRKGLIQCVQRIGGPNGEPVWKERMVHW